MYSRVFHEEFKFHDFLSLKKKLWHLKDTDKVEPSQIINKTERKQKSPKKISRDKECGMNVGLQTLSPMAADHMSASTHHNQLQSLSTSQDMYILPVNLQDLQLPQASDMITQQHHAMQLNLHTFSTQSNVLSPLMNVQGSGAQGLQCSSVVTLPGGTMSLAQNSSGYMNVNTASFYQ